MAAPGEPPMPAELGRLYAELEQRGLHQRVDGVMVRQLLDGARAIEEVRATAAGMQLGAEGFDNTERARAYSSVQQHVIDAARNLLAAAMVLRREAER